MKFVAPVYIQPDGMFYKGQKVENVQVDSLTDDDVANLVITNFWAAKKLDMDEELVPLYVAAHVMCIIMGAVDSGGEMVIVDDVNMSQVTEEEEDFLAGFAKIAPSGALLCAAGALNHYVLNHTTGQGGL